ncbi:MAG: 23S rRNA (guanosine(2251)-2'-O)-methyltransferase RlmB [Betaproteobacteria bacterium]|jgi:23S rRNA (guanosine2251-2'-O)-methyltransferase|nr:MAG: 23S rRNA (guanosine(2251)-2'-O)-methyltransferase RlmB [Betaproteobacteria bacterium]
MSQRTALAGFHAVTARLRNAPQTIESLYYDPGRRDARMRQLLERAEQAAVRPIPVEPERLQAMVGPTRHQGVVALCARLENAHSLQQVLEKISPDSLLLLLDGITDPRNLGACLRTAEAAAVTAVVLPRDRSASLSSAALRAASGAVESVAVIPVVNLARSIDEIKETGVRVVGADHAAPRDLYAIDLRGPLAWALGAEGHGLRRLTRERCDELARIPLAGQVESLNVSVAAGICLFETRRQRSTNAP